MGFAIIEIGKEPEVPTVNVLSIVIENETSTANAMTEIRLRVVDSLGVKTAADVELSVYGSHYRRQTGGVVPPIGEYVIIAGQGMLRGNLTFTASKEGYKSAVLTSILGISNETMSTTLTETKAEVGIVFPIPGVVGVLIIMQIWLGTG